MSLAYVYFEDELGRQSAAKLLTRDEARGIAANIDHLASFRAFQERDERLGGRIDPATKQNCVLQNGIVEVRWNDPPRPVRTPRYL